MGLLDDAIREHLDLKRRRGGDPTEIERAERDALGPVRRNREGTSFEEDASIAQAEPGSARDEPDEGIASDLVDERGADPGYDADDDDGFAFDDEEYDDDADDVAPATRVMRAADIPAAPQSTAEFDVAEVFADDESHPPHEDAADGDEDVLEETPEFLQDTPDHERLWFEQRPPRDFDFDG